MPINYPEAAYWYNKSAKRGNSQAQFNLAWMYYEGEGVTRDYEEAVYWYTKAAELEELSAQYNLALMYYEGKGVTRDYEQAYLWWSLAAAKGHEDARKNLDIVEKKMTPEQVAEAQRLSREWKPNYPKLEFNPTEDQVDKMLDAFEKFEPCLDFSR